MNQLTPSRPSSVSAAQDPFLVVESTLRLPQRDVRLLQLVNVDGEYPQGTPINDEDRRLLKERGDRLASFGRDQREAAEIKAIGAVLTLPRQASGDDSFDVLLQVFRRAVEGIPTWAVERAADEWIQGRHGDGRFGPGPSELAIAARGLAERPAIMAAQLRKAAAAPVGKSVDYDRRKKFAEQVLAGVVWNSKPDGGDRPVVPDADVRGRWEADMCRALADTPHLLEPFQAILAGSPDLIERATAAERAGAGRGWASIAHFVAQDFIKAERSRSNHQEAAE